MRSPMLLATVFTATLMASVSALDLNGWYPCGPTTKPRAGEGLGDVPEASFAVGDKPPFECAQVPMPLCHEGLCKGEAGERIHVFVRRLAAKEAPAQQQGGKKPKALWFIQGGPSLPSTELEAPMYAAYKQFNGTVSLYTMDHRGTGRSHFLQCEAAQADADGSNSSTLISTAEMDSCLRDLKFRYKNKAAAFSISSAAWDLKKIVEGLHPNHDVYVQGFSYGTALVQRLVQLAPLPVRGYIFEGVSALTTKKDKIQTQWARADELLLGPTRRLLEACFDDSQCPLKFTSRATAVDEVLELYKKLDAEVETNLCSQFLQRTIFLKPSDGLRSFLSEIVETGSLDALVYVPLVLAKMKSCSQADLDLVGPILDPLYGVDDDDVASTNMTTRHRMLGARRLQASDEPRVVDPLRDSNQLLFDLIVGSELFGPAPSIAELTKLYNANPLSKPTPFVADTIDFAKTQLMAYGLSGAYCRSTGSSDEICKTLKPLIGTTQTFSYGVDKYHDAPLKLADTASALILTGGLDFDTPAEHGDILLKKLEGGRGKLAITFKYGGHCRGEATREYLQMPCHNSLVEQFVLGDGDVKKIDQRCLATQPKIVFPTTYDE